MKLYRQPPDATVLVLEGELNSASAAAMRAELEGLLDEAAGDVAVDLSGVAFLDSSGAGALVFMHRRLAARARALELVGVSGQPLDLLTLLRIGNAIPINRRPAVSSAARGDGAA